MWRLVKAEIVNDKLRIFLAYFFAVITFITIWYGVNWERNRAPMAMMMMVVATLIVGFICEKKRIAQKRGRLFGALPISTKQIGFFHLIYLIVCLEAVSKPHLTHNDGVVGLFKMFPRLGLTYSAFAGLFICLRLVHQRDPRF